MIRFAILLTALFLRLIFIQSIQSQQTDTSKTEIKKPSGFISLNFGLEGDMDLNGFRMEASFNKRIHQRGFLGLKIGSQSMGAYFDNVHIGPCYNYSFLNKPSSPFMEFDLRGERTTMRTTHWTDAGLETLKYKYFGASGYFSLGYRFKPANKKIGFEFKSGLGPVIYKEINHSDRYKLSGYMVRLDDYFLVGASYYF